MILIITSVMIEYEVIGDLNDDIDDYLNGDSNYLTIEWWSE